MIRWIVAGCSVLLLLGPQARAERRLPRLSELNLVAQPSDEPTTPGEPSAKKPSDEPQGKPGEPAIKKPGDEPGHRPGDPTPTSAEKAKPKKSVLYGAGIQVRGLFVPSWFLGAFLDRSTALNSASIGGEFIRRKGNFDLVASINFGFYSPPDGNYLGRGKNPAVDVDYIQFRNLNVLAFDVAFIWHHDFLPWLSLIYGAGLGFGVVLGDIYRISNSGCTPENAGKTNECYPKGMDLANREAWLAAHTGQGSDSPDAPHLYLEDGKWPVIPIVHLLIGLNFKITEKISIRVDGGFHDAFYCGATGHYFF